MFLLLRFLFKKNPKPNRSKDFKEQQLGFIEILIMELKQHFSVRNSNFEASWMFIFLGF